MARDTDSDGTDSLTVDGIDIQSGDRLRVVYEHRNGGRTHEDEITVTGLDERLYMSDRIECDGAHGDTVAVDLVSSSVEVRD